MDFYVCFQVISCRKGRVVLQMAEDGRNRESITLKIPLRYYFLTFSETMPGFKSYFTSLAQQSAQTDAEDSLNRNLTPMYEEHTIKMPNRSKSTKQIKKLNKWKN